MIRSELLAGYGRFLRAEHESERRVAWDAMPWRLRAHLCFSASWVDALTNLEVLSAARAVAVHPRPTRAVERRVRP